MTWSAVGAAALAAAVMLGAFGAHGLRGRLDDYLMGVYERAAFYHFIHAIGLLVVPVMARLGALKPASATVVCALLLGGIVVFSGSLYALAITGHLWLGAVTPIGGVSFIAAWIVLAVALLKR